MSGLKSSEIHWVVSSYIGVAEGYLGDFTYRSHKEFYPAFCDLDIDPEVFPGTTRERFIAVLSSVAPPAQAAILNGVMKKYPVGSAVHRNKASFKRMQELAAGCTDTAAVSHISTRITSELLRRALADASALLRSSGATSAVDRIHTAMHAYLKAACHEHGVNAPQDSSLTQLFKCLRQEHPGLMDLGSQDGTMARILHSLSNVIDSLNPARNRGSLAHANEQLLAEDEAILVINSARTIFQYLDAKLLANSSGR